MSDATRLGPVLVTGGGGYFGRLLANRLAHAGLDVRALDIFKHPRLDRRVEFVEADIRDADAVREACEGRATVFHTAAVIDGVTLASKARRARVRAINVDGTRHVLDACRHAQVPRLVHTSSNNVVFDREIILGDEHERYASGHLDLYTESKRDAERLVLAANSETLDTVALRPGGIYGPGERHHLPRLVRELLDGRFVATVGDGSARADNIYIDNLIDAHLAAAGALMDGRGHGRAYFISDDAPANYFEFFRPIVEDLGYRFPRLRVPRWLMRALAFGAECVSRLGGPEPFMSSMELRKVAVTHTFRLDAARRDLGFSPAVAQEEGVARCLPWAHALHEAGGDLERAEAQFEAPDARPTATLAAARSRPD